MTQGQDAFSEVRDAVGQVVESRPTILAAIALALAGFVLGRSASWLVRRLVRSALERLARIPSLRASIESSGVVGQAPLVLGAIAFWALMIFFGAIAMETVGLPVVTESLSRAAYFLPNVLAALLIVFIGLIAGRVLGASMTRAAANSGLAFGPRVGGMVRGTVILMSLLVALEQVGIQANILIVIVAVVVGAALAGAGLAFGLGARTAVGNLIGSHYVAQSYRAGQRIRVGTVEGRILEITPTAVVLATADGRVLVPASHFGESMSTLLSETTS
jgi:small-conductance mechanosensitive channel